MNALLHLLQSSSKLLHIKIMENKLKFVCFLPLFALIITCAQARSIVQRPKALSTFKINATQNARTCSFTVSIRTSCSSPRYTRDAISLSFGDAYGNQVYAPRLDDPSERTFEGCSEDTFDIRGPCTYQICYLYLYRSGYDGWIPETVRVYGYNTKAVTFYYNTYIPADVWYGFDNCYGYSVSSSV